MLMQNQAIPSKFKDYALAGNYVGYQEKYLELDWLNLQNQY